MNKTIIFASHEIITLKKENEFYFSELNNNFIFLYWDLFDIIHKNKKISYTDKIEDKYNYKKIISMESLCNELYKINKKQTLFILDLPLNYESEKIYKLFISSKYIICSFMIYDLNNIDNILMTLAKVNIKNIIISTIRVDIIRKILNNNKGIKNIISNIELGKLNVYLNYYLCCSNITNSKYDTNKIIQINHFDYDKYLYLCTENQRVVKKKYCVYLDQYFPYHPDSVLHTLKKMDADIFYSKLTKFFHKIQTSFNLEVVVAAHPSSNYNSIKIFNEFKVIKYKTAELVKDCEFVIAHSSLSINFAVLFNKPIISIYTNEMKECRKQDTIITIKKSKLLGSRLYKLETNKKIKLRMINEKKYKNYIYKYLTHKDTEKLVTGKIITNKFNQILGEST